MLLCLCTPSPPEPGREEQMMGIGVLKPVRKQFWHFGCIFYNFWFGQDRFSNVFWITSVTKYSIGAQLDPARLGPSPDRLGLGSAQSGPDRLGSARPDLAKLGSARPGPAQLGSARIDPARHGSARLGPARSGSARKNVMLLTSPRECW